MAFANRYGIDILDACNYQYGFSMEAILVSNDIHGWRCGIHGSSGVIIQGGVDLWRYCAYLHGGNYGAYNDNNSPYGWYCAPKH